MNAYYADRQEGKTDKSVALNFVFFTMFNNLMSNAKHDTNKHKFIYKRHPLYFKNFLCDKGET